MGISAHVRKQFVWWVNEREQIRLSKMAGQPPPWTKDRILSSYRFCNVRRRDDRVSRWIAGQVIAPYAKEETLAPFLALCRFVNWPPTIQTIMAKGLWPAARVRWRAIGSLIDRLVEDGQKTWTGAYMVKAPRHERGKVWTFWGKGQYVAEIVVERELEAKRELLREALQAKTRHAVAAVLASCYGWGSFMAGQVIDDWTWTSLLADASDHYTWAPLGPGSQRGLNRLSGRPLKTHWKEDEYCQVLIGLREQIIAQLGAAFADLTLHDVSNCCCEFDKYERVRLGEGRPRSNYIPASI